MSILPLFLNPLTFLVNLFLGLLVLKRDPKRRVNRVFASLAIFTAFWGLFLLFYGHPIVLSSLAWLKIVYLSVFGIVYGIFYLSYIFPDEKRMPPKTLLILYFLATAFFFYIIIFTDLHVFKVVKTEAGWRTIVGVLYPLYPITLLFFSGIGFMNYAQKVAQSKGLVKTQTLYLLIGLMIFSFLATIFDAVIPLATGSTVLFVLSPITSVFFIGFTAYAIVKHRLMDIRLIVARTVTYSLLFALFGILVASGLSAFGVFIAQQATQRGQNIIITSLALFMAFSFSTLTRFFEKITDKIFFKERYNVDELLGKLSWIMASTLQLEDLTDLVLGEILQQMRITRGAFALTKNSKISWVKSKGYREAPTFDEKEIFELFHRAENQDKEKILIFEEVEDGEIKEIMRENDLTIALPLIVKGEKEGLLLLGEKSSGDLYSPEDINVFKIIAPEIAVAIKNSKAYEEIRRFSITLKEEVKRATWELKKANEKLKELDKLKDEFLSIATHELRTPMTAIKGYLDMILSGDAGKINKRVREFLNESFEVTDRLTKLVNDMLDVSRIEQRRLTLEIKNIDLSQEVKKVVEHLASLAREKKMSLTYKPFRNLPQVKADSAKVRQILNNLIGNAIKFTEGGGVTISHRLENGFVVTQIKDTGIGIAKEDMSKLFQKFSKLDGGLKREGGTGLGLYISTGLVETMGGKIWAKSELGKGSTFSFSLPKAK